ncbi:MAG: AmmeMemoRadiSam system radical SAM enzyme [Candidatus Margulisbacteria bacterium]|nr:AmmeMemoRadiSam system radical SAM enzyme [Candidatus Margulisiibacteriota bacterium]
MRRILAVILALFLAATLASAIQFTSPFARLADALRMIREANLSRYEALYYQKLGRDVVQCQLCPNRCTLANLARGLCGVRINLEGKLYSLVYGKPIAIHVDPIEKKPLSHFLPGTTAFSISTAGCNLGCVFCQNWQISQVKPEEAEHYNFEPEKIVNMALDARSPTIAYTYTEPTIFYEYMLATAKLAKKKGLRNIMHSCGYINPEPLKELLKYMDACNIDLKGFSEDFYQQMCYGRLEPVLETIKTIKKQGVWLEITNLVIPGKNDDPKMIRAMCRWIKANVGPDVPLYFSAFYPQYKLANVPPTPVESLEKAYKIAREEGLNFVYVGNVYGHLKENTYCPKCGEAVVKRLGFSIEANNLINGKCKFCGYKMPGVWK